MRIEIQCGDKDSTKCTMELSDRYSKMYEKFNLRLYFIMMLNAALADLEHPKMLSDFVLLNFQLFTFKIHLRKNPKLLMSVGNRIRKLYCINWYMKKIIKAPDKLKTRT